jgi:DNA-binding NarL/FixJ family response regulator
VEPIRILLASMPRLMADIVAAGVEPHRDLRIVGSLESVSELASQARRTRPDVLVLGLDGSDLPRECDELFADRPHMRILGVEANGGEVGLYELRPHRVALGSLSPAELARSILSAARAPSRLGEVS